MRTSGGSITTVIDVRSVVVDVILGGPGAEIMTFFFNFDHHNAHAQLFTGPTFLVSVKFLLSLFIAYESSEGSAQTAEWHSLGRTFADTKYVKHHLCMMRLTFR